MAREALPRSEQPPDDDPFDVRVAFGRGIRALRLYHVFTQQELGERSGLNQSTVSRLETGRPTPLRFASVFRVLDAMWVDRTVFKTRRRGSSYLAFLTRNEPEGLGPEPQRFWFSEPLPRDPWWPSDDDDLEDDDRPSLTILTAALDDAEPPPAAR